MQESAIVRRFRKIDILDHPAEALVYSTNVHLHCSGGVGAALVDRYGPAVQEMLRGFLAKEGRRSAPQGTIFEGTLPAMPSRQVFHTVPTDFWHNTTPEVVERVLREALSRCVRQGMRSVALSALATGYGDLLLADFLILADRVLCAPDYRAIPEITLCLPDAPSFALACKVAAARGLKLQSQ